MRYLLDVNALVAWGWQDHSEHTRVAHWIRQERSAHDSELLTSPISQLGFVRVSVHRGTGKVSVDDAAKVLAGMLATLGARHGFVPDTQVSVAFPSWCRGADRTTDAHLTQLADSIGARLATCDERIPGSFLIPS